MVDPAGRRERESVDAFLDRLRTSASQRPMRTRENVRTNGGDSQVLTGSHRPVRGSSAGDETGSAPILTVSPDRAEDKVKEMVAELAEDIDYAIAIGVEMPCTGSELQGYYADQLRHRPADLVLADVSERWKAQVVGEVLPLDRVPGEGDDPEGRDG